MTRVTRIQPGQRIPIRLNQLHRSLVLEHAYMSPELEGRIRDARIEGGAAIVSLDLDDLDELLGAVAAEANHCQDTRVQRQWDDLYDALRKVERRYTDRT